jgi:hypothetical protein
MMDRQQEMQAMRENGYTYREIGEAFGVSGNRAYYIVNQQAMPGKYQKNGFNRKQWRWVAECRKEGYSLKAMAAFLGVKECAINYNIKRFRQLPPLEDRKAEFNALPDTRVFDKVANWSMYSPAQWEWINDRYFEGYRVKALAAFLGLSPKALRNRVIPRSGRMLPSLEKRRAEFESLGGDSK